MCSRYFVGVVVVADVCSCGPAGLGVGWRVFGCWTVCTKPRGGGVRVSGVRVVAGRVGAVGWVVGLVGGQVAMQCVVDILFGYVVCGD